MHRTTISLDEGIYRRVCKLAERRGLSMARTIEQLLREALTGPQQKSAKPPIHRGGPKAGVDIADRDRLYALMEGR